MTYLVRPMLKEDIAQVTAIDREAFPTQIPPPNYRHELQNQLARYIVVCDDTRTITETRVKVAKGLPGLASRIKQYFRHSPAESQPPTPIIREYIIGFAGIWVLANEAHITNIAVRKEYQHKGLGELLLIATMDLARRMRASIITLEVRASNFIAQNLYRKFGFTQTGIRRGYYLDNREDGIIMSTENINSPAFEGHLKQLREAMVGKLTSQITLG